MKKIHLSSRLAVLFFFLFSSPLHSQIVSIDWILIQPKHKVESYERSKDFAGHSLVSFNFGDSIVQNPTVFRQLKNQRIARIDFVYTKYKSVSDFNQMKLNKSRFKALLKGCPDLFNTTTIDWNINEIKEANTPEKNEAFFHGFVIYYAGSPIIKDGELAYSSKTKMKGSAEIGYMKESLKTTPIVKTEEKTIVKKKTHRIATGYYLPNSQRKRDSGIRYEKPSKIWKRRKEYEKLIVYDTTSMLVKVAVESDTSKTTFFPIEGFADTVVTAVFERHKAWREIAIVEDVTGSMYPYTMQTLLWKRMNDRASRAKHFVFFNDGDSHPDGPIGKSGGAYYIDAANIDQVEKKCYDVMSKGGGGSAPENNIEALLFAVSQLPETAEIVMIADNWANIRDKELMSKIKVPVHIVLCGVQSGMVNIDYLNLALATGGTVHTLEEDIENLTDLTEGQTIKVGNRKFKVKNGMFTL